MNKYKKYEIFCDAKKNINYYKGEILPFINKLCRKNMTSGDIDGFVWDYNKKTYIAIEQKWSNENNKKSQDLHLKFLSAIFAEVVKCERFCDYKFYVLKIIGDPPFEKCKIINIADDSEKIIDRQSLVDLFEMNKNYEEL